LNSEISFRKSFDRLFQNSVALSREINNREKKRKGERERERERELLFIKRLEIISLEAQEPHEYVVLYRL